MNVSDTELAEQLRAGIAGIPAAVPGGLARRAYRRSRRPRVAARAITAAGTLAAAAVAAVVFLTGPGPGPGPATQNAAYVVAHVAQALDAMPTDTIMVVRFASNTSPNQTVEKWSSPNVRRAESFTRAGQPMGVFEVLMTRTSFTAVSVNYQARTWWESTRRQSGGPSALRITCASGDNGFFFDNASYMATWLRDAVSCGMLKADGTATVNGVSTIKLTGTGTGFEKNEVDTYFVNPTTYLPVHLTSTTGTQVWQDDLQWLPPTAANLAALKLPVPPAGFTKVAHDGCTTSGECR